jgi:hypothetical protein
MRFPNFQFNGKKILVISQQPWSKMRISKHHYSLLLAQKGNKVFFLGPPIDSGKPGIVLQPADDVPEITLIHYTPFFSHNLRFHFRWIFDKLIKRDVNEIIRKIGVPDITWCFETNVYSDLRFFKGSLTIFHVVDPVAFDYQKNVGKTADIIIGVSQRILKDFEMIKTPKYFVNHGLCRPYADRAERKLSVGDFSYTGNSLKVGYIGNLTRGPVDHELFYRLISLFPNIEFHFWGNANLSAQNSGKEVTFINFLKASGNVVLHGVADPDDLAGLIGDISMFLLVYKFVPGESDLSNSHKLLEYLSTGKHIVSSPVETYNEYRDIIFMPSKDIENEDELVKVFSDSINRIGFLNSEGLQKKRMHLSLTHTYEQQLTRIQTLIVDL